MRASACGIGLIYLHTYILYVYSKGKRWKGGFSSMVSPAWNGVKQSVMEFVWVSQRVFFFCSQILFLYYSSSLQRKSGGKTQEIPMKVHMKIRIHIRSGIRIMAGSRARSKVQVFSSKHSVVTDWLQPVFL